MLNPLECHKGDFGYSSFEEFINQIFKVKFPEELELIKFNQFNANILYKKEPRMARILVSIDDYVYFYFVPNDASVPLNDPDFSYDKAGMAVGIHRGSGEVSFKANETISRNYITVGVTEAKGLDELDKFFNSGQ